MVNAKQKRTLAEIFDTPVRSNIAWKDVESLLLALGADITEGRGSRVRIEINGKEHALHRPYSQKELKQYAARNPREFLTNAGIEL